jgi:hypothetical protein
MNQATTMRQQLSVFMGVRVSVMTFMSDDRHFIVDTGASITITNDAHDFNSPVHTIRSTLR